MTFLICSVMIWRFPFISLQVLHLVLLLDFLFYSFSTDFWREVEEKSWIVFCGGQETEASSF